MALSQTGRALQIFFPKNQNLTGTLVPETFKGVEALSGLFTYALDVYSEAQVLFEDVLGAWVTVYVQDGAGKSRYVNGIVRRFRQKPQIQAAPLLYHYKMELVPSVWLLTLNVQSRIFQGLSTKDILQQTVFQGYSVDYSGITGSHPTRDHCVQYNESDFAFASRLMEEEGIYYYFQHVQSQTGGHTMYLTDQAYVAGTPLALVYNENLNAAVPQRVSSWEKVQQLQSGQVTVRDYSFELSDKPSTMKGQQAVASAVTVGQETHELSLQNVNKDLTINDYPNGYAKLFDEVNQQGVADTSATWNQQLIPTQLQFSKILAQRQAIESLQIDATSDCVLLQPGGKFTLSGQFNAAFDDASNYYLITRVVHKASIAGTYTTPSTTVTPTYSNQFQCVPSTLPYQPARRTPRPRIDGTHTATVRGASASDTNVYCDKYGRVKVKFRWDCGGDDSTSCWVRVSQVWAGQNYGAFFWPRPGHEVVVSFEDGDPDRPLITGSVYNNVNMPPMGLPTAALNSGFKTWNSDGKVNTITFQDGTESVGTIIHSDKSILQTDGGSNVTVTGSLSHPIDTFEWTYGQKIESFAGLHGEFLVGAKIEVIFNPLGALPEFKIAETAKPALKGLGGFVKGARDLIGGHCTLTIGSDAAVNYGPRIDIHHGEKIEGSSALEGKAKIAIIALGAVGIACTGLFVFSGLSRNRVDSSGNPVPESNTLQHAFEVLGAVATSALLGIEHGLALAQEAKNKANATLEAATKAQEKLQLQGDIDTLKREVVDITKLAADAGGFATAAAAAAAPAAPAAPAAQPTPTVAGSTSRDTRNITCDEYTLTGKKTISFAAAPPTAPATGAPGASLTLGHSSGTPADGHVNLVGLSHVDISTKTDTNTILLQTNAQQPASNGILIKSDTNVKLTCGAPILPDSSRINLKDKHIEIGATAVGPKMEVKSDGITMTLLEPAVAAPAATPHIDIKATGITLEAGASKIVLALDGITLQCGPTSIIEIKPDKVSLEGLSVATAADIDFVWRSLQLTAQKVLKLQNQAALQQIS